MSTFNGGPQGIVTNGLVLYLDAANRDSYVSGSTTWNDLSRSRNTGTLTNGPVFSSANAGSIVFDGVNDRLSLVNDIILSSASDWSLQLWIKSNQTSTNAQYLRLLNNGNGAGTNYFFFEWNNRILSINSAATSFAFQTGWTPALPIDGSIFLLTVIGRSGTLEVYQNITKTTVNATITGNLVFNNLMIANGSYDPGGNLNTFSYYNRALSVVEILQNYNSMKARFGL